MNVANDSLATARLAEYRQRRKVALLRQRLYAQPDPSASTKLTNALMKAEAELHRVEKALRQQERVKGRGVLLDTGEEGTKPGGILMGRDTTGVDVQVLLRMSHVPTGIVHLLDAERTPLVSFAIKYVGRTHVRLRLTSLVEGYSAHAVDTVELKTDGSVEIRQLPTFFADRLESIREMTRATLHIKIDDLDGKTEQESTFPIWLLARTSAYNGVEDPSNGEWVDLSPYYGAWVTPNAPEVMAVLRRAADLHPEQNIVGYQVDASGVEEQVKALFNALKVEGIVYINSVLSFGATKGEYMQRVRLPRESLATQSANCIDGTVLMASLLEAASLNPGLVLVPGHAFLAWETQDASGEWDFLETTMIGSHDFAAAHDSGKGTAKHYQSLADHTGDSYYFTLLSLPELRAQYGIFPME
jgi:hypothetical protein